MVGYHHPNWFFFFCLVLEFDFSVKKVWKAKGFSRRQQIPDHPLRTWVLKKLRNHYGNKKCDDHTFDVLKIKIRLGIKFGSKNIFCEISHFKNLLSIFFTSYTPCTAHCAHQVHCTWYSSAINGFEYMWGLNCRTNTVRPIV